MSEPVGNRLREFRKAAGLTLGDVASQLGTTATQVARLEKGTRRLTVEHVRQIAPIVGADPSALMDEAPLPIPVIDDANHPGPKVRALREHRGMSLNALAKELGVYNSALSLMERGRQKIDVPTLTKIATALGVGLNELIDGYVPAEEPQPAPKATREHRVLVKADWWLTLDQATRIFAIVDEGKE